MIDALETRDALSDSASSGDTQEIIECLQAIAVGQFNQRPSGTGEIAEAVRQLTATLQQKAKEELQRTVRLSSMASESMASVSFVSGDVKEVAANAHNISSAAQQLSDTSQELSESTNVIVNNIEDVSHSSDVGMKAVESAIHDMTEINQVVTQTSLTVEGLAKASKEIDQILAVIVSIASQTNLLSLNARIEAARAGGEVGKGFAVVAGEVKELANQSAVASDEIGDKIKGIQTEIAEILSGFKDITSVVKSGQQSIDQVGTEIHSIVNHIRTVSTQVADNARSVNEQQQATEQVSQRVAVISEKSDRSSINVEKAIEAVASSEKVIAEKFAYLGEMDIPDAVVDLAKSDHFTWKKRLAEMLIGRNELKADELADHHSCRLGKWYDSQTEPKYIHHPEFKQLETPHRLVHEYGIEVVAKFNQGDIVGAIEAYEKMEEASHGVMHCLDALG